MTSKGYGWLASTGKKKWGSKSIICTLSIHPADTKDTRRPVYTPCRMQHRYGRCPASAYRRRRDDYGAACVNSAQAGDPHTSQVPRGLPWWLSGEGSICQCRGHRFGPQAGRTPHAGEQLGLEPRPPKPTLPEPRLCSQRGVPACPN